MSFRLKRLGRGNRGYWADIRGLGSVRVAGSGPRVGLRPLRPIVCAFFQRPFSLLVNVVSTSFFPPFFLRSRVSSSPNPVYGIDLVCKGLTIPDLEKFGNPTFRLL